LGLSLIGCGVFAVVFSIWWYWGMVRYLWHGSFASIAGVAEQEGVRSPIIAIGILLIGIGLFAFFAVLFRVV
jgi:putative membrane protein